MSVRNVARTVRTLEVPYESILYLREEVHRQRCEKNYKPLSEKTKERIKRGMPKDGMYRVYDGDLGGCKGDPKNAWREDRWTSWSIDTIKRMLDEVNLPYGKEGTSEVIDVYF